MPALRSIFPRALRLALGAVALVAAAGCTSLTDGTRSFANTLSLYRPEVVQGNFVSREQANALHPGMTRQQVRDILGTPLMTSVFHNDRWDYVFTMKRQGVEPQQYHLTAFFHGDALSRVESDELPSETEFVERISPPKKVKVPQLEATQAQLDKFPVAEPAVSDTATAAATTAPAAASGAYPPLERAR